MRNLRSYLKSHLAEEFRSAPVTYASAFGGIGLYCLDFFGILPVHNFLFHPVFLPSISGLARAIASFFILEGGPISACFQVMQGVFWKRQLEKSLSTKKERNALLGKTTQNEAFHCRVVNRAKALFKYKYFRIQLLAMGMAVSQEAVLYGLFGSSYKAGPALFNIVDNRKVVFRPRLLYSLKGHLEYALFFIYAMCFKNDSIKIFDIIPVRILYIPFMRCILSKFSSVQPMLKSLLTAVLVSKTFSLKTSSGEDVVSSTMDSILELYRNLTDLLVILVTQSV